MWRNVLIWNFETLCLPFMKMQDKRSDTFNGLLTYKRQTMKTGRIHDLANIMRYLYGCFPAAVEGFGSGKFKFRKHTDTSLTYVVSLGICDLDYAKMRYTKNVSFHRIHLSGDAAASIKIICWCTDAVFPLYSIYISSCGILAPSTFADNDVKNSG